MAIDRLASSYTLLVRWFSGLIVAMLRPAASNVVEVRLASALMDAMARLAASYTAVIRNPKALIVPMFRPALS